MCCTSGFCYCKDCLCFQINSSQTCCVCNCICDIRVLISLCFLKDRIVINVLFHMLCDTAHHLKCLYRIFTSCCFSGKHSRTCSLEDRIGNVCSLCTGWSRMRDHGVKHLCCSDDRFACCINFLDDLLLDNRYIFRWNLNTHVTSGDHNTVCCFDDLIDIVNTLLVLNLGNDLDFFTAVFFQDFSYFTDIISSTCKRCCNKVKSFLNTEKKVIMVFLADKWHLQVCARNIDTFFITNYTCVDNFTYDIFSCDILNFQIYKSVINQNVSAWFYILIKFFISNAYVLVSSFDIFICKCKNLSFFQRNLTILEASKSDLRSLCIKKCCNRSVIFLAKFSQLLDTSSLFIVRSM